MIIRIRRWMRQGTDTELRLLPLLKGRGAFIDVGANVGSWAGPACRIFSHVHAFEPDTKLARALKDCAPRNLTVHAMALSDKKGVGVFSVPLSNGRRVEARGSLNRDANPGMAEEIRSVSMVTLDSLALTGIDAIKIDVEGHEEAVLAGACQTLQRERPSLIIEIEERHHRGRSELIIANLVKSGFAAFFVRKNKVERFQPGMLSSLQLANQITPEGQPKLDSYINNFIFVPLEKSGVIADVERFVIAG